VIGSEVTGAVCLEGERSCPPEDVGGLSGYMDYLEALRDSFHPDHGRWWNGGALIQP